MLPICFGKTLHERILFCPLLSTWLACHSAGKSKTLLLVSVEAGCLLWRLRVVPAVCQTAVLKELHTGIVRLKLHSCGGRDVEQIVRNCASCQAIRNAPPAASLVVTVEANSYQL